MSFQHSPPSEQKRSQVRAQAVLTPTPRVSLDGTPAVPQLRFHLDRGQNTEVEEWSAVTEAVPAPVRESEGTGGPTLTQYNHPVSHQSEPSLLVIMHQMTHIMANLRAASSSEDSRPQAFKDPSMKAPDCFDGTQLFKVQSFIQSCQFIFHSDKANFPENRKKFPYATSAPIGRAAKCI
ncbi:hypothetical protein O181_040025 [Austropuccinia psidii MF-1]|uniref:Uncharacterized protein n=1 Tax=Austropuccinia psidii MF-1 TaxID=1389203 RepID=A0A9Q3DCH7_9BASI|nr:hypothetical protein [Austropuccinia psidii MF-1]